MWVIFLCIWKLYFPIKSWHELQTTYNQNILEMQIWDSQNCNKKRLPQIIGVGRKGDTILQPSPVQSKTLICQSPAIAYTAVFGFYICFDKFVMKKFSTLVQSKISRINLQPKFIQLFLFIGSIIKNRLITN